MNVSESLLAAYSSGAFREKKYYIAANGILPNSYVYKFDRKEVDLENVDLNKLKQCYPNAIINSNIIFSEQKNSAVEEVDYDDYDDEYNVPEIKMDGMWTNGNITIYNKTVIFLIEIYSITMYYNNENPKEELEKLFNCLTFKNDSPKDSEIYLVAYQQDYYTTSSKITSTTVDLSTHYNDDFIGVYNDICKFLDDRNSGLIILRGAAGSGKTNFIRHLITNHPKHYVLVTNAMATRMSDPEFVSFMLEHKNSVFILEDCEQILMDRSENLFGGAISNILNMSDGLLSDVFNIKFICTFNADLAVIDPALLRKGRCYTNYEFKPLCLSKTNALLRSLGKDESYKEMTLAEIYNTETKDFITKKEMIGFNVK